MKLIREKINNNMEKLNWLTMAGYVETNNGGIVHRPGLIKCDPLTGPPVLFMYSHIISNIFLENGEVTFNVRMEDQTSRCQLVIETGNNEYLYIGINTGVCAFGIMRRINGIYQMLSSFGNYQTLSTIGNIDIKIIKNNYQIILFANGIKVAEAIYPVIRSAIGIYFEGNNDITVTNFNFIPEKRIAFVVMQYLDEYNELFKEVIRPVCEKFKYDCIRADDYYTPTPILSDIIASINNASIIIAEITSENPNVFYEIGYSHAINKPTILLCDKNKVGKLPFDISRFRTLFYENTISGKTKIEANLSKYLENYL